jgi:BRCA1/BRCA2-containing complex subunit 3
MVDHMKICVISAVMTLRRSDKQPDRVEISPEQLSDASSYAEVCATWVINPVKVNYVILF